MSADASRPDDSERTYLEAAEKIIQRAMNYMGQNRALQIAASVPIDIDSRGNIEEVRGDYSGKTVAENVLAVYVEVVGRQMVVNIVDAALSGPLAQELKALCRENLEPGSTDAGVQA